MTARRTSIIILVIAAAFAACGDDDSGGVFERQDATTTSAAGATTTTATTGTTATSTTAPADDTTTTTEAEPVTFNETLDDIEFPTDVEPATSNAGAADPALAIEIARALSTGGVDLTGFEVWVFDIVGSGEQMLVLDVDGAAVAGAEQATGNADLFGVLSGVPAIAEGTVSRLTIHIRDSDDQGPYVLTTTVPTEAVLSGDSDALSAATAIQLRRDVP